MNRIASIAASIILAFVLVGCCAMKSHKSVNTYTSSSNEFYKSRFEQLYLELRDSSVNIKAPVEKSESRGLLHSFLETSLAWSRASVDSMGVLHHMIANKDSIPSKEVYRWRDRLVYDTVFINKVDTIKIDVYERVEKSLTPWQGAQIWLGRVFLIFAGIGIIFTVLKWKLKF